ncbi:MAG: hypothetical protein AB8B88_11850 [Devosiaceae bacterium]
MKSFLKKSRLLGLSLAAALLIQPIASLGTAHQSHAGEYMTSPMMAPIVAGSGGSTAGGWIVGGIFFSVASIIACAMIVGAEEDREMTLEEALLSGAIPLGCLFREHFNQE